MIDRATDRFIDIQPARQTDKPTGSQTKIQIEQISVKKKNSCES